MPAECLLSACYVLIAHQGTTQRPWSLHWLGVVRRKTINKRKSKLYSMLQVMNAIGRSKENGPGNGEANWCIFHRLC